MGELDRRTRTFLDVTVVVWCALWLVIDAFVVRSLLVPSLLVLVGRHSWWPRTSAAPERSAPGVEPSPATQGVVPNRRL